LLNGHNPKQEFLYGDTHAGRPQYVLPEKGEWGQGIGEFSKRPAVLKDRSQRLPGRESSLGVVGAFDEAFVGRHLSCGMIYPGSSGLAFRGLRESPQSFRMLLWEKDRAAADDLIRFFYPWQHQEQVSVVCGDGYEIVNHDRPLSLVLIDPPALESGPVLQVCQWLNERGTPFLCWTPRTSLAPTEKGGQAREARTSTDFIKQAGDVGYCFRVRWHKWGSRTPGCCITVSAGLSDVASKAVRQTTELMGWQLEE
jgi:hypothetical protein